MLILAVGSYNWLVVDFGSWVSAELSSGLLSAATACGVCTAWMRFAAGMRMLSLCCLYLFILYCLLFVLGSFVRAGCTDVYSDACCILYGFVVTTCSGGYVVIVAGVGCCLVVVVGCGYDSDYCCCSCTCCHRGRCRFLGLPTWSLPLSLSIITTESWLWYSNYCYYCYYYAIKSCLKLHHWVTSHVSRHHNRCCNPPFVSDINVADGNGLEHGLSNGSYCLDLGISESSVDDCWLEIQPCISPMIVGHNFKVLTINSWIILISMMVNTDNYDGYSWLIMVKYFTDTVISHE